MYGGFETRFKLGIKPWNTGLGYSGMTGKHSSVEARRKIGLANRGRKRPDLAERLKDPEYQMKRIQGLIKKPTKPELKLIQILGKYSLPFRYVGDGKLIVGRLNPDFVHSDGKKLIEVFGRIWHDQEKAFRPLVGHYLPEDRIEFFRNLGYGCMILWEDELESDEIVAERIKTFMNGDAA